MKFTVIIPLEFNRGLAVRCIRAWAEAQSFPRADFEIIVAAAETHDSDELGVIRGLLFPHDRIVKLPVSHDMALVAGVARLASGEVLVFTESHCLPEPDFLEASCAALKAHPEWGGFSGKSMPLTHNLLSVVEAELYAGDIDFNLAYHAWLKVLDQCFVIYRKDYQSVGGIDAAYGHFAEWHLAGRLHLGGIKIGHVPAAKVGHYYIGDIHELKTFTMDFAAGEMRCAAAAGVDECSRLFDPPRAWKNRVGCDRALIDSMMRVSAGGPFLESRLRFFGYWLRRPFTLQRAIRCAGVRLACQRGLLAVLLALRWKQAAKPVFRRWMVACAEFGRLRFLAERERVRAIGQDDEPESPEEWSPATADRRDSLGWHELEQVNGIPFRWSHPAVVTRFKPGRGVFRISVRCLPDTSAKLLSAARFFINARPIKPAAVSLAEAGVDIVYENETDGFSDFAWGCREIRAPGDKRPLGMPVVKISWRLMSRPAPVHGFLRPNKPSSQPCGAAAALAQRSSNG